MGKRGPKPTPTAALEKRGSWLAKTRGGEPEPESLPGVPPVPAGMQGEAAETWRTLAPVLVGMGTLTTADLQTFERYCRTLALWRKLMLGLEGATVVDRADVLAWDKVTEALRRMDAAFGLSPADRAGMKLPDTKDTNASDPFQKPKISAA